MVTTTDSQTCIDALRTDDVTELLTQFLANVSLEVLPAETNGEHGNGEVVIGMVVLDGMIYTLSCRPCPVERAAIALSPREGEIVRLVMKGMSTHSIALLLDISPWTVSTHLRRIFLKLSVSSRAEMVAQVLRDGLLAAEMLRQPSGA